MFSEDFIRRYPEVANAFENIMLEIQKTRRPANEVYIDDFELRSLLGVSQRTCASWREARLITYSKVGNKISYKLSDVFEMLERHRIPSITDDIKSKLYEKTSQGM